MWKFGFVLFSLTIYQFSWLPPPPLNSLIGYLMKNIGDKNEDHQSLLHRQLNKIIGYIYITELSKSSQVTK
jgi:hypothetical protein